MLIFRRALPSVNCFAGSNGDRGVVLESLPEPLRLLDIVQARLGEFKDARRRETR